MLLLNVFKGQLNNKVLAKFKRINCTCSFIQVCDVAINKPLKDWIAELAELAEIHYNAHNVGDTGISRINGS